jgi:hypothetical protein
MIKVLWTFCAGTLRCRPTHAEYMQMSENKMISIYLRRWAPKDAAAVRSDVNRSEGAHVTSECPDFPPLVLIIVDLFPRSNRSIATWPKGLLNGKGKSPFRIL